MTLLAERTTTTEHNPEATIPAPAAGAAPAAGHYVTLPAGSARPLNEGSYVSVPGNRSSRATRGSYVTLHTAPAAPIEGSYVSLSTAA
ncbi:hypothetical protein AAHB33_09575 [Paenarthrobacter sp. S56]|uniref:hypothetical protein n=1 Tax=Paenarthrobacter sp. S56 TaxID=3138179 RepID=UPI00321A201B